MHDHDLNKNTSGGKLPWKKIKNSSTPENSPGVRLSPKQKSVLQMQKLLGNRVVQRMLRLDRKSDGGTTVGADVEGAIKSKRGTGKPLDEGVRGQMEPAMGADFSGVNVHDDAESDTLSRSLNAKAFTTGKDVFFRQGAYSPGSSSGRELIAHELTHVEQQTGGKVQTKLSVNQPGDKYEQEADKMASAVMQQEKQGASSKSGGEGVAQRAEEEEAQAKHEPGDIQRAEEEEAQAKHEPGDIQRQGDAEKEEE